MSENSWNLSAMSHNMYIQLFAFQLCNILLLVTSTYRFRNLIACLSYSQSDFDYKFRVHVRTQIAMLILSRSK